MTPPLLYEVNARCWLRELTQKHSRSIHLGNVPEEAIRAWADLGFTHIWLMGVWTTGPRSRALALNQPDLRREYDRILPGWQENDIAGSPYAIGDYLAPPGLGGDQGLKRFREQLHAHGMKLILDAVFNHLGLDHPWVKEHPELFVQSRANRPDTFSQETKEGTRWLAHGKDPYFPAWTDTAQLDFRQTPVRGRVIELLRRLAAVCDGVRCDMSMLLLNDIFAETWRDFPGPESGQGAEFWKEAIQTIKQRQADFIFIAEVYWGMAPRLQSLGFDYTYHKEIYDFLIGRDYAGLQRYLLERPPEFLSSSVHFLENHDEARIASKLSWPEHRCAALLAFTLPGMRLIHEGQLQGAQIRTPVQLARRPNEMPQQEVASFYERLLRLLKQCLVGHGRCEVLRRVRDAEQDPEAQKVFLLQWTSSHAAFDLVAVNLSAQPVQCDARFSIEKLLSWEIRERFGNHFEQRAGRELQTRGFNLDLEPYALRLYQFRRHIGP